MHVLKGDAQFDERRNTSRVFQPPAGAGKAAAAACRQWGDANWAHRQWIMDGHPTMTEAEHVERFGVPYRKGGRS